MILIDSDDLFLKKKNLLLGVCLILFLFPTFPPPLFFLKKAQGNAHSQLH